MTRRLMRGTPFRAPGYALVRILFLVCILTAICIPIVKGETAPCGVQVNENDCQKLETGYIDSGCSRCIQNNGVEACIDSPVCERSEQCYALCTGCISTDSALVKKYHLDCKACGCSAPVTQPPPEEPFPWILIVGPLAIAAIAAIAITKGMGKKKPEEKKEKKEGQTHYILQISPTDTIKVSTTERGSFTATAWKVDENGVPSRANNASISLVPPPGVPGLSVVPVSGMGSVNVSVSIDKSASVSDAKIQVNASAGGAGISAFVTVKFEAEEEIEFD